MKTNEIKRRPARKERGNFTVKEIPITEQILPMSRFYKQYRGKPVEAENGDQETKANR